MSTRKAVGAVQVTEEIEEIQQLELALVLMRLLEHTRHGRALDVNRAANKLDELIKAKAAEVSKTCK